MNLLLVIQLTNDTIVQANKDAHLIVQYLVSLILPSASWAHNAILLVREDLSDHDASPT